MHRTGDRHVMVTSALDWPVKFVENLPFVHYRHGHVYAGVWLPCESHLL